MDILATFIACTFNSNNLKNYPFIISLITIKL